MNTPTGAPGQPTEHTFSATFTACWACVTADRDATVMAILITIEAGLR